jgi:hypothetical protein
MQHQAWFGSTAALGTDIGHLTRKRLLLRALQPGWRYCACCLVSQLRSAITHLWLCNVWDDAAFQKLRHSCRRSTLCQVAGQQQQAARQPRVMQGSSAGTILCVKRFERVILHYKEAFDPPLSP